jgi:hypothetical protein
MKIFLKVKPGATEDRVSQTDETHFEVSVRAPPVKGLANAAVLRLLSDYFKVPLSAVRIVQGRTSRNKIIDLEKIQE